MLSICGLVDIASRNVEDEGGMTKWDRPRKSKQHPRDLNFNIRLNQSYFLLT